MGGWGNRELFYPSNTLDYLLVWAQIKFNLWFESRFYYTWQSQQWDGLQLVGYFATKNVVANLKGFILKTIVLQFVNIYSLQLQVEETFCSYFRSYLVETVDNIAIERQW